MRVLQSGWHLKFWLVLSTSLLMTITYFVFLNSLKDKEINEFNHRARLIQTYTNLLGAGLKILKEDIEQTYHLPGSGLVKQQEALNFQLISENQFLLKKTNYNHLSGNLSGVGKPANLLKNHYRELNSILKLGSAFNSVISSIPEITWVYFTSKNNFIYLSPPVSTEKFLFTGKEYKTAAWFEAIPENNSSLDQVITMLYRDLAGTGLMITISSPVILDNKFTGVISMDLGIEFLRGLLKTDQGDALGKPVLIDENELLVAEEGFLSPGSGYPVPDHVNENKFSFVDNQYWLKKEVSKGDLWLVHTINSDELAWAAIKKSLPLWMVFIITLGLAVLFTRLRGSHNKVLELTRTDPLTGMLNRRGFYDAIKLTVKYEKRNETVWSMLMLDIDHFKQVNDSYGHDVGDQVIEKIGSIINLQLRDSDISARWGGEEFLLFLPNTTLEQAGLVANSLIAKIASKPISQQKLTITMSAGCAEVDKSEANMSNIVEHVIKKADLKLYEAKQNGRNQVSC